MTPVSYGRLSAEARHTITWATMGVRGASIAGYVRRRFPDGEWGGDRCGCDDDRCITYHHDAGEACGCLQVLLIEYVCGVLGHLWGDTIHEHDYGRGLVRWQTCTRCTAANYLQVPEADGLMWHEIVP